MYKKLIQLSLCLLPIFGFCQKTITGTVVDEANLPLPGATILEKGTTNGAATDFNGEFEISVAGPNSILIVRFLGYQSKEVEVKDQSVMKITLSSNTEALDAVVVVGYGEQERGNVTGAITSLEPEQQDLDNARSVEDYLQGRAAGVYVSSNGFEPNSPSSIKIRGTNSLTGNSQPLYVIDGIIVNSATEDVSDPLTGGSTYLSPQSGITGLNPRDIESVEFLKDASATAIYGSRGSNGVIIITTKQGQEGKARFDFSVQSNFGQIVNDIEVLSPEDYISYQNDYREVQGFSPNFYVYEDDGSIAEFNNSEDFMIANSAIIPRLVPVNWSDYIYRNSISNIYRLSVSGGSESTKYYISGGYTNTQGIVPRTYAKVGDFNINLVQDLNDKMKLRTKISASLGKNSASKGTENLGGTNNNLVRNIYSAAPFFGVGENTPDEVTNADLENVFEGPIAWLEDYDDLSSEFRILARTSLQWKLSKNFTYTLNMGGDYRFKDRSIYYGLTLRRGVEVGGEAGYSELKRFRYNIDNLLEYKNKSIKGGHNIEAMVGFIVDNNSSERNSISGNGFPLQDLRADGISNAKNFERYFLGKQEELIVSGITRISYNYKRKYVFNFNLRADGSSNFSDGNRWGYFPSLGLAWNIDREKFLKNSESVSGLKLRAGWGLTGNQNINPYSFFASYVTPETVYADGDTPLSTTVPANLVNSDLTWETTSQYNVGIDLSLYDDRINFTADAYHKNIYDLLINYPLPGSAAFSSFPVNQGSLINKGLEFSISADIFKTDDFSWNLYGNISFNKNEVGDLGDLEISDFGELRGAGFLGQNISGGNYFKSAANIFLEGFPAAVFFGYETNGIINDENELAQAVPFQGIDPQLGDVFMVDQNGDGVVNDLDRTIIGDPNPDYTFGLGSTITYKNFSLNFLFNGVQGNQIANANLQRTDYAEPNNNNIRPQAYFDAWTPENPNGQYPRLAYDLVTDIDFTDRLVEDASFVRFSNLSLSYEIPMGEDSFINRANITIAGRNLALWTNYSGFDPEVESYSFDPLRVGVDRNSFPNQRSFSIALNVGF